MSTGGPHDVLHPYAHAAFSPAARFLAALRDPE